MTGCGKYGERLRLFALDQLAPREEMEQPGKEGDQAVEKATREGWEIGEHLEECPECRDRVATYRNLYEGVKHAELEREAVEDLRRRTDSCFLQWRGLQPLLFGAAVGVCFGLEGRMEWGLLAALVILSVYVYNTLANRILDLELTTRTLLRRVEELGERERA